MESVKICLREVGRGEVEREAWPSVKLASLADWAIFLLGGEAGQALLDLAMLNNFVASAAT